MWCFNNGTQWSFSIGLLTKTLKLIEIIGIIYCQYWHCRAAISSHLTQDSKNAIFSFKIIFMLLTCLGRYICFSEILIHNSLIFTSTTFNACINFIMVFLCFLSLNSERSFSYMHSVCDLHSMSIALLQNGLCVIVPQPGTAHCSMWSPDLDICDLSDLTTTTAACGCSKIWHACHSHEVYFAGAVRPCRRVPWVTGVTIIVLWQLLQNACLNPQSITIILPKYSNIYFRGVDLMGLCIQNKLLSDISRNCAVFYIDYFHNYSCFLLGVMRSKNTRNRF